MYLEVCVFIKSNYLLCFDGGLFWKKKLNLDFFKMF